MEWAKGIEAKRADSNTEVLFYVGCYGAFDHETMFTARATANLLNKTGSNWGVLEDDEFCCGFPLLDVGYKDEFERLAKKSIESINATNANTLVVSCACCFGTMKEDWPKVMPLDFEVMHSSQYLLDAVKKGKLRVSGKMEKTVTFHDPCHLGRIGGGVYEEPRQLLQSIPGIVLKEMERNRGESWCCGAGGGVNACSPDFALETATRRLEEAAQTGAESMIIPSCPICYNNFATVPLEKRKIEFEDLSQMIDKVT
jgi:heterodisulfide reductase subunit D